MIDFRVRPMPFLLALLCLCGPIAMPANAHDPKAPAEVPPASDTAEKDKEQTNEQEADADDEALAFSDEVEVRSRADDLIGFASSATEGATGREDLERRPLLRPAELVETVPGVIATQHSGAGKANQYFLRGFNLDHGTDFSVWVDGVPVNMPSHGHGQGYTDLNFLIPELVGSLRYRKGPYYASRGDFSAAGGVDMQLVDSLPEPLIQLTGGSFDYGRVLLANTVGVGDARLTAAVDLFHNDGPWERGEDYKGGKAFLRLSQGDQTRGYSISAVGYDADWLATDQVPRRAVESGLIDEYGLIDPGSRGDSSRYSLSAEMHRASEGSLTHLNGYLLHYDLDLLSNFTYFLDDPVNGDEFEQVDDRLVAGLEAGHSWLYNWGGRLMENSAGVQLRADDIDNGLFRGRNTARIATVREDRIKLLTGGVYAESLVHVSDKVHPRLGLRADIYSADVESDLAQNSGTSSDVLLSPKLGLTLGPWNKTEIYINAGYGFHSNDARGTTIRVDPTTGEAAQRVEPLVRAKGADVGFRTTAIPGLQTTMSIFLLELESELLFVGDGGSTEASRPSRRRGVELTNFYRVNDWLTLDLDATLADASFTDDDPVGSEIPGAIKRTVAAGISIGDGRKVFGGLRWRYFNGAPLIEDGSVRSDSSSLVNGRIGVLLPRGLSLELDAFNLLDRRDSDIQYFYSSRLPGEPDEGIEDVHFHPMERRSVRLIATWRMSRPEN